MTADGGAIVFLDVDGTLTSGGGEPTPRVLEALQKLKDNGHLAFLCTGRPLCNLWPSLRSAPLAGMITLAGGYVLVGGRVIQELVIPEGLLRRTVEEMTVLGMEALFEGTEGCCVLSPSDTGFEGHVRVDGLAGMERHFPKLDFSKIVFSDSELPKLRRKRAFFEAHYRLFDIAVGYHEITVGEINKRDAILKVLEELGRDTRRTFGIGDSENDVGMLRTVETPIVMGNALPAVRDMGKYITGTVLADGAVDALAHFGLI